MQFLKKKNSISKACGNLDDAFGEAEDLSTDFSTRPFSPELDSASTVLLNSRHGPLSLKAQTPGESQSDELSFKLTGVTCISSFHKGRIRYGKRVSKQRRASQPPSPNHSEEFLFEWPSFDPVFHVLEVLDLPQLARCALVCTEWAALVRLVLREQCEESVKLLKPLREHCTKPVHEYLAAHQFLYKIKKSQLDDLASSTPPPEHVEMLGEAICILFGINRIWPTAQSLLTSSDCVEQLLAVDATSLPPATATSLCNFLGDSAPEWDNLYTAGQVLWCWLKRVAELSGACSKFPHLRNVPLKDWEVKMKELANSEAHLDRLQKIKAKQ
eukprot:TRINITY_DN74908_c0_g1_i1.p2 TRINITY_DN74908_c0_g1~~TRINITY_DN74908_c0_g1_i1.p2  ORF type:complete len:328 (+),score=40.79 TRINITY_DN74908_c0_g1_i1:35-1018(+)